ncbi:MAG: ice-binding family protein, partial [Candidatus Woesebacteria bacterium]|nr:ice-binding family protein [Candidatus Woesebacteria bacterium]
MFIPVPQAHAATAPDLGAAGSFSVLGGETVTNTGSSTIAGDLGVSPGSAVTGFPPGIVTLPYTIHKADGGAALAQLANTAAFLALSAGDNAACTVPYGAITKDLVGLT